MGPWANRIGVDILRQHPTLDWTKVAIGNCCGGFFETMLILHIIFSIDKLLGDFIGLVPVCSVTNFCLLFTDLNLLWLLQQSVVVSAQL